MVLHFQPGSTVLVKSGISMVSAANARENLHAEQPGFDFDGVRAKAQPNRGRPSSAGSGSRITNVDRKKIFYTAMYHMMCAPTLADDVNGQYRGLDKKVHTLAKGEHNYSTYSLWDTYRALHPIVHAVAARTRDSDGELPGAHGGGEQVRLPDLAACRTAKPIACPAIMGPVSWPKPA